MKKFSDSSGHGLLDAGFDACFMESGHKAALAAPAGVTSAGFIWPDNARNPILVRMPVSLGGPSFLPALRNGNRPARALAVK